MTRALAFLVAVVTVASTAPPAAAAPDRGAATVKVFFLLGEQLVPVQRDGVTIQDALAALLAGPTADEAANGVTSAIPPGSPLYSVTVVNGLATVDLGEKVTLGTDGEVLASRLTQLVSTAASVPGVKRVQVLIKGGVPLGLFPGFNLARPVTLADVRRPNVPPPVNPTPAGGAPTDSTRAIQQRLADLGYLAPSAVDGIEGPATTFAIQAFQKWEGLPRDGIAGPQTKSALTAAARPTPIQIGSGRRVEVLLDRQLVLLIDGSNVVRTIPVSTGKPGYETPPGVYKVYSKQERSWSVPYRVWLPWASYFNGGIAFHEYPEVPVESASHGCVRVPLGDAQYLYGQTPLGTPVVVLATSR